MKISPEFLPLVEWWEKEGKQTLVYVAVAAVAVAGYYGVKNWRAAARANASNAFVMANTVEELEEAASKYSGADAGASIRLRLAKAYFDAENYEGALKLYDELASAGKAPEGFEDVPAVGCAQCLEALEKYDEAVAAFDAFIKDHEGSFLALTAKLGAVRALALGGKRDEALKRIEGLKEACKGKDVELARVNSTEDFVKRYEKRAKVSLADAAAEAAKQLETEPPAEAKPAEAKPVEEKK